MRKYLIARCSMLDLPDKVWKFRNPWSKPSYRLRETIIMNKYILPMITNFWVKAHTLTTRKKNYYLMRYRIKTIKKGL